ncbi:glucose/galactose transporter [Anseongella ginsenosidimutans]|uniref:Glucose/galactose transporter n=1 Tax=Anseongella ginsenosidimutans TaxID=496056 RepID=A0A4R3KPP4_9SPHI|nr:sugar MFS transporter [Anseongella ginsenosidimutans]QEC53966.1 sugar MFS transporter [Anseongella ginsenosidimutans]TCS86352.1 glucose/galactose transporter [Anseongella ginsenosidimutans]
MSEKLKGYTYQITVIGILFFVLGFVTWLNSILIPYLRIACELTNFESYLVTFASYIAYFFMAIPSSWILKRTGLVNGMALALLVIGIGALLFIPAAMSRAYIIFLLGLFVMGTGMAILQTAVNPYATILGPVESAAKRISIMGVCNKVAGMLSPLILGAVVFKNLASEDEVNAQLAQMALDHREAFLSDLAMRVIAPAIVLAVVMLGLALLVKVSRLPEVELDEEVQPEEGAAPRQQKTSVLQFPFLVLGVFTIFFYVGVEVMAVDTIASYGSYFGFDLGTTKVFPTYVLICMVIGYFIGIITIPKYLKQDKALAIFSVMGMLFLLAALFTTGFTSIVFIALLGLAHSIMWPAIWPLALEGLGRFTKIGSALLIMGIAGGAIIPPIYGKLADVVNPQHAYWVMIPCYLFILFFAVKGHKIGRQQHG